MEQQLEDFAQAVSSTFLGGIPLRVPRNWAEAFELLHLEIMKTKGKVVLFFDELPWLATPRSGLMNRIDYYWNNKWAGMQRIVFVACGSSASWLLKHIIYHKGGLHNRTTLEIKLLPFNLHESKEYLHSLRVKLDDAHIVSLYMALGGIPYYLAYASQGLSSQQIVQRLFFDEGAPLYHEYKKLFDSLFTDAPAYTEIIELIAKKRCGLTRAELKKSVTLSAHGGHLTQRLQDLCDAGFIKRYIPWGKTSGMYYKVIDEFCLFYLTWLKGYKGHTFAPDYWMLQSQRPAYYAWAGYAYEAVCAKHIHQIIRSLGVTTVQEVSSWRSVPKTPDKHGVQINLVLDRIDNAITLCEIKYTASPFVIDKRYAANLVEKLNLFKKKTKTTKQLFLALVSAHGLKPTMYAEELVSGVVTLEDLFTHFE